MAHIITRDPSTKWYLTIDWAEWIADQALLSPNGPGLTITMIFVEWFPDAAITQEPETSSTPRGTYTDFIGSGGVNRVKYDITARITYSAPELSVIDLTQDKTVTISLRDQ